MKKLIYLFLALTVASCTISEEPDFLKLDDYKLIKINNKEVILGTNAYFKNPNDVGCEVVSTEIDVFIHDLAVGKVNQTKSISLESNNEFSIPLKVSIPTSNIIKDKGGLLGGLLSTLTNKNITVKYSGIVTLKKAGIEFDIDIDGEETLKEFKK